MIKFQSGETLQTIRVSAGPEVLKNHRRDVVTIVTADADYDKAASLFVDGAVWSIVDDETQQEYTVWNSYTVAGPITDGRDGTVTVKMGKENTKEQDLEDSLAEANEATKTAKSYTTMIVGASVNNEEEAAAARRQVELMYTSADLTVDQRITNRNLAPLWEAGEHNVGEVFVTKPGDGLGAEWDQVWEVHQAYNNEINPDIVPGDNSWYTFNKPYHGRTPETARPFIPVQGSHDMYRTGEYMIFTDGLIYKCKQDTNFSPTEFAEAWEIYPEGE